MWHPPYAKKQIITVANPDADKSFPAIILLPPSAVNTNILILLAICLNKFTNITNVFYKLRKSRVTKLFIIKIIYKKKKVYVFIKQNYLCN